MGNSGHCGFSPKAFEESRGCCSLSPQTGHGFLGVHIHWLGLAADETCPVSGHVRMDGDHLLHCTGLDEYPTDDGRLSVKLSRYGYLGGPVSSMSRSQARVLDK
ncbi:hypothetical protein TNCV_1954551 [Trichonephila clavipes]|nr:hypothetical protein TNCV_1954551 [Trichonephila clavipes]